MTAEAISLQPGFVLRRQPYRETSLILEVFTRDHGRVPLLAKGVRTAKSNTAALLQPFAPLALSYLGKSGLKTLTHAETSATQLSLPGLAVYCGFYVNELVGCFLHPHDPHPELFADYRQCLRQLATGQEMEAALRRFELALLKHCGYGLQLDVDSLGQALISQQRYRLEDNERFKTDDQGSYSGAALLAISNDEFHLPGVLGEAKRLMRAVIDGHLQGRPLHSRTVFNQVLKNYERC